MAEDPSSIEVPSEVRTFLIADVRGYTRFTHDHGDAAAARLADRFADIAKQMVAARDGQVIELRGDEALAIFASPRQAIRAALELQSCFSRERDRDPSLPLTVGMGLDAGEAIPIQGGYRGGALNLAARLCSLAGPSEVFASETVMRLARKLDGCVYLDRGQVQLKGLVDPIRVIQVVPEGAVPRDVPKFTVHVTPTTNLPTQPTVFIGREREVLGIAGMLRRGDVRLLTLTGPGGTGKTRLALQVAVEVADAFPDGSFFVSLAPISDPDLVVSTIASTLGVKETGSDPVVRTLTRDLRDKELLLVLDNFEHLLEAAPLVGVLVSACPKLTVLVTSQAVLHLAAEHEYAVPPLSVPDPRHLPDLASLSQYDAVALFIERAQAAKVTFAITNENAPAVAEICSQLDGLPLAIELAAARIKLFPPQALLGRLSTRLNLLTGGARDAPTRQRTLRGAIAWSYNLLADAERALFARLSVFAGGCTLEAAEAVATGDGDLEIDVLDGVASLVDKSLLQQEGEDEPRFRMLETIREYATERLEESESGERIRQAFAEYYVSLAEEVRPKLEGPMQKEGRDRLEAELDNLRAALSWTLGHDQAELGLRLSWSLARFWELSTYLTEGQKWLEEALAAGEKVDQAVRVQAVRAVGRLILLRGDLDAAALLFEESLAVSRLLDDKQGTARSLLHLGTVAITRGNHVQATAFYEEGLVLSRDVGDTNGIALALGNLGYIAYCQGNLDRAQSLWGESLALWREQGDTHFIAYMLNSLGCVAREQGAYRRAKELLGESLGLYRQTGDQSRYMISVLEDLAAVATLEGEPKRAAWLYGASEAWHEVIGAPLLGQERAELERYLAVARSRMSEAEWIRAWNEGRGMPLDQAMVVAEAYATE